MPIYDMPQLPFELVLEIAAFCAGSFNFETFLNLALTCRQTHKSLQPVLSQPILVLTELEFEGGIVHRLNGAHVEEGNVPEKWRNMRYVSALARQMAGQTHGVLSLSRFIILLMGNATVEARRKEFARAAAQLSALFPTLAASIHQYDCASRRPESWTLVLHQLLTIPLAAAILRHLPLAFDKLDLRDTDLAVKAPELVTIMKSLSVHIFDHALCESTMEGGLQPQQISPVCMFLSLSPEPTWFVERQTDAGICLPTSCEFASAYSALALTKQTELRLHVLRPEGERRITFSVLRQVSFKVPLSAGRNLSISSSPLQYRSLLLAHPSYIPFIHLSILPVANNPVWIDAALDTMFDFYMRLAAVRECPTSTSLLSIDARGLRFCRKGPSIVRMNLSCILNDPPALDALKDVFRDYPIPLRPGLWIEPELEAAEDEDGNDNREGFEPQAEAEEIIPDDEE